MRPRDPDLRGDPPDPGPKGLPAPCPACGSPRAIPGSIHRERRPCNEGPWFLPDGLPSAGWFRSTPVAWPSPEFRVCLDCGLVWSHCDPSALRAIMDEQEAREGRRQSTGKMPPHDDLE